MGKPRCSDMNLYEYNRSSARLLIVSRANTPVRPSKLAIEGMHAALCKSPEDEAWDDDLER